MSHYSLEMILPPHIKREDVYSVVSEVLRPFDENLEDNPYKHTFFDYWRIGGRWSGDHVLSHFHPGKVNAMRQWCRAEGVKVSGLVFGKETLADGWREKVDAEWQRRFPDSGLKTCPLFDHFPDDHPSNICTVGELGEFAKTFKAILVGPGFHHEAEGKSYHTWDAGYKPREMAETEYWNGVSWCSTDFDGLVLPFIAKHNGLNDFNGRRAEYAHLAEVTDDWLAVTIDYHS